MGEMTLRVPSSDWLTAVRDLRGAVKRLDEAENRAGGQCSVCHAQTTMAVGTATALIVQQARKIVTALDLAAKDG
jgi:hypothetical protein